MHFLLLIRPTHLWLCWKNEHHHGTKSNHGFLPNNHEVHIWCKKPVCANQSNSPVSVFLQVWLVCDLSDENEFTRMFLKWLHKKFFLGQSFCLFRFRTWTVMPFWYTLVRWGAFVSTLMLLCLVIKCTKSRRRNRWAPLKQTSSGPSHWPWTHSGYQPDDTSLMVFLVTGLFDDILLSDKLRT